MAHEYKVLEVPERVGPVVAETALNNLAMQGWRLVQVLPPSASEDAAKFLAVFEKDVV